MLDIVDIKEESLWNVFGWSHIGEIEELI